MANVPAEFPRRFVDYLPLRSPDGRKLCLAHRQKFMESRCNKVQGATGACSALSRQRQGDSTDGAACGVVVHLRWQVPHTCHQFNRPPQGPHHRGRGHGDGGALPWLTSQIGAFGAHSSKVLRRAGPSGCLEPSHNRLSLRKGGTDGPDRTAPTPDGNAHHWSSRPKQRHALPTAALEWVCLRGVSK